MGEATGFCVGHCGGAGAVAGGRGGGVRDSAVFFTWASEERFLEAAGLATLRRIRGGAGQGGEGQHLGEEGRHAGPSAAREQRLVAENDVEPGLGWLAPRVS